MQSFSFDGTPKVVGILNPKIMDGKDAKKNDVTISIDHPDKLMEFGESVDLGSCDFVKPSGQKCTNIVNRSQLQIFIYLVLILVQLNVQIVAFLCTLFHLQP